MLYGYMEILWRVTPRFTEVHGYTLEGYNKVYRDKYMDIHWRVTTRFTEVHGYALEGYNNIDMNTRIYIGGLQQCLQT